MDWFAHVTVAAIVEEQGRFLLVEEMEGGERVLNQPAGHLENAENLIDAVVRETLEETAHHFVPQTLVGVYQYTSPNNDQTYLRFAFAGTCDGGDPIRALDDDILQVLWLSRDEMALRLLRSPMVLQCVDDYLAGRAYPLDMLHTLTAKLQGQG